MNNFMPMPPWREIMWIPNAFLAMLKNPGGFSLVSLAGFFFIVGIISFFRRKWQQAVILSVPFFAVLLASGFEKYPFSDRLLLFIIPLVYILISEGVERFSLLFNKVHPKLTQVIWIALICGLLFSPFSASVKKFFNPSMRQHIKPLLTYITEKQIDGDILYLYYGAQPAFDYYKPFYYIGNLNVVQGIAFSREDPIKYIKEINQLKGNQRVWFLFSHNCSWCIVNEEEYIVRHLNKIGKRINKYSSSGSNVYLYNLMPKK